MSNTFNVSMYVDGACSGNHQTTEARKAGYGAVLIYVSLAGKRHIKKLCGPVEGETLSNNIAELTAVLRGLESIGTAYRSRSDITVYSDSKYVVNTFTTWINSWVVKNSQLYKKGGKELVANSDTILEIRHLASRFHNVRFLHVKGHAGDEWNEEADRLAKSVI